MLCTDTVLLETLCRVVPATWQVTQASSLEAIGEFQELLLHRFVLLDLDERTAFNPVEIVVAIRSELMLNVPIFCVGGEPEVRNAARLARADRFFERDQIVTVLPRIFEQFGW